MPDCTPDSATDSDPLDSILSAAVKKAHGPLRQALLNLLRSGNQKPTKPLNPAVKRRRRKVVTA